MVMFAWRAPVRCCRPAALVCPPYAAVVALLRIPPLGRRARASPHQESNSDGLCLALLRVGRLPQASSPSASRPDGAGAGLWMAANAIVTGIPRHRHGDPPCAR